MRLFIIRTFYVLLGLISLRKAEGRKVMSFGVFGKHIATEGQVGGFADDFYAVFLPLFESGIHILDLEAEFDAAGLSLVGGRQLGRLFILQADPRRAAGWLQSGKDVRRNRPQVGHAQFLDVKGLKLLEIGGVDDDVIQVHFGSPYGLFDLQTHHKRAE